MKKKFDFIILGRFIPDPSYVIGVFKGNYYALKNYDIKKGTFSESRIAILLDEKKKIFKLGPVVDISCQIAKSKK